MRSVSTAACAPDGGGAAFCVALAILAEPGIQRYAARLPCLARDPTTAVRELPCGFGPCRFYCGLIRAEAGCPDTLKRLPVSTTSPFSTRKIEKSPSM